MGRNKFLERQQKKREQEHAESPEPVEDGEWVEVITSEYEEAVNDDTPKLKLNILEKDFISCFLRSRKIWVTFNDEIHPDNFEYTSSKTIFKIFKYYWDLYQQMPTLPQTISMSRDSSRFGEVRSQFDDYVEEIYKYRELREDEIAYLFDKVRSFVKRNKLRIALINGASAIDDEDRYGEVENEIKEAIMWNEDSTLGIEVGEDIEERYKLIEELYKNGIPSPWPRLNEIIGGQLFQKELTIIVSPSGVGKSLSLGNFATHTRNMLGKNVVYISLELSQLRVAQRLDANIANVEFLKTVENVKKIQESWKEFNGGKLFVKEFPTSTITANQINDYLYKLKLFTGIKPDLIVVDHLDAMRPNVSRKGSSMYSDGGAIAEELRALGYIYECPVLTGTQANRDGYNIPVQEFTEKHLGESMKKLHTCDNLIALVATDDDKRERKVHMKTLKARNGKPGLFVTLKANYPLMRFESM